MNTPFEFLAAFWPILLPSALGLAGVYLLMPRVRRYPPLYGAVCAGLALAAVALFLLHPEAPWAETVLFYAFSGIAIISGTLMITLRNPVHSALSFAMVVLSTCGLFLLQAAPFLMAATIIIYAGAIVVTFLFVIMLAQQAGVSDADQRSREPFLATVAGFVLLGCILAVLQRNYQSTSLDELLRRMELALETKNKEDMDKELGGIKKFAPALRNAIGKGEDTPDKHKRLLGGTATQKKQIESALDDFENTLTSRKSEFENAVAELKIVQKHTRQFHVSVGSLRPDKSLKLSKFSGHSPAEDVTFDDNGRVKERLPHNNVAALGKSLFSDYLLPLELAGVLLLVATIGAIVIAGRRTEGLR